MIRPYIHVMMSSDGCTRLPLFVKDYACSRVPLHVKISLKYTYRACYPLADPRDISEFAEILKL
jgi:hypothetical protein